MFRHSISSYSRLISTPTTFIPHLSFGLPKLNRCISISSFNPPRLFPSSLHFNSNEVSKLGCNEKEFVEELDREKGWKRVRSRVELKSLMSDPGVSYNY
jgi:hypothetical protein